MMNSADLVSMIGRLSQSLLPVETLLIGAAYLLGMMFVVAALMKFHKIGDARMGSQDKISVPFMYLLGGAILFFLPTATKIIANSAFGASNVLQYASYNTYSIQNSMVVVIQTAGLLWFIRGCVLITHASEPGVQEGPKGFVFLIAGILAMNFEYTTATINDILGHITSWTLALKTSQGF